MKRLTKRNYDEISFIGEYGEPPYPVISQAALESLACYEDTGVVPFEIRAYQTILGDISIERLEEIMQAEAEGRLVALPCKVGTKIYEMAHELECDRGFRRLHSDGCHAPISCTDCKSGHQRWYVRETTFDNFWQLPKFGKTLFLTREEAEAKIVTMKEGFHYG